MAPQLNIPKSDTTVNVSCINTTTNMVCPAEFFVEPIIPGHEFWNMRTYAFLIENPKTGRKLLFDSGARKDWWNLAKPVVQTIEEKTPALEVEKSVHEILEEGGVDLKTVDHIVWSHWHWDHTGDPSKFPSNTRIVVGPGFKKAFMPGCPARQDSPVLESDFRREVLEMEFNTGLKIGQFNAVDFFGDDSFYILDVPGHAIGHISALARVTPDTFVFLGGDVCHYGGSFRPTEWKALPSSIPKSAILDARFRLPCPCSIFTDIHPLRGVAGEEGARRQPFFKVTQKEGSWYTYPDVAQQSVDRLTEFDASDDVFVCIAHDGGLYDVVDFFPTGTMNGWKAKTWKEKAHWGFVNELPVQGGRMSPIATGVVKESKLVSTFDALGWESRA